MKHDMSMEYWMKTYGPVVNPEAYADQMTLYTFFEGIGVLVKKGLIDVELVEDLFSQRIIWIWEQCLQPSLNWARKITDDPSQYDHTEYLYNELMRYIEEHPELAT